MELFSMFFVLLSANFLTMADIPPELSAEENVKGKIDVRLYSHGDSSVYKETVLEDLVSFLASSNDFDPIKPVMLVFHGLNMKADNNNIKGIVNAFGKSGKWMMFNVMVLQMERLFKYKPCDKCEQIPNKCDYSVIQYAKVAGNHVGDYLSLVVDVGLTGPEKLHFAGYSLGAHTAGYAARRIALKHLPINYIAGLDPAGFVLCLFHQWDKDTVHLTSADARIVHMFHTNGYFYGLAAQLGTADFYFNNGYIQPGCYTGQKFGCSHARSVYFFTEAILDDKAFVGRQCGNFASFSGCVCDSNSVGAVTFPPDESLAGVYYVCTRDVSPYGLGLQGTVCHLKSYWEWFNG